jgi:hypothetical protein
MGSTLDFYTLRRDASVISAAKVASIAFKIIIINFKKPWLLCRATCDVRDIEFCGPKNCKHAFETARRRSAGKMQAISMTRDLRAASMSAKLVKCK